MNEKEQDILDKIINFYRKNNYMPTIRDILHETNYKSTNTIYKYIKKLVDMDFLIKDKTNGKIYLNGTYNFDTNNCIKKINIINTKETLTIETKINKQYIGFQIKNNYFENINIQRNDYLIIEKTEKLKNNDLGLFIINKKYRIMKYEYYDGFYFLTDNTTETLYRVKIIGKVVSIYRKRI